VKSWPTSYEKRGWVDFPRGWNKTADVPHNRVGYYFQHHVMLLTHWCRYPAAADASPSRPTEISYEECVYLDTKWWYLRCADKMCSRSTGCDTLQNLSNAGRLHQVAQSVDWRITGTPIRNFVADYPRRIYPGFSPNTMAESLKQNICRNV